MWQKVLQSGNGESFEFGEPKYSGTTSLSANTFKSFACGFKPKYIVVGYRTTSTTTTAVGVALFDVDNDVEYAKWSTNAPEISHPIQNGTLIVSDNGYQLKFNSSVGISMLVW